MACASCFAAVGDNSPEFLKTKVIQAHIFMSPRQFQVAVAFVRSNGIQTVQVAAGFVKSNGIKYFQASVVFVKSNGMQAV